MAPQTTGDAGNPGPRPPQSTIAVLARLAAIGVIILAVIAGYAYVGGWLSPERLSPAHVTDTFEQVNGIHAGFRRNHAKGLCLVGSFESNGQGARLSKASVFAPGRIPVIGRFSLAGGQPYAADAPTTVRALGLRFALPDGEEWRTAMIDLPLFPFKTPEAFYEQLVASRPDPVTGKPDPEKMKAFLAAHPETTRVLDVIHAQPVASGFDNVAYNGLNAFRFVDGAGKATPVRWSMVPVQPFAPEDPAKTAQPDKNYLFDDLIAQVAHQPLQWHLVLTVGQAGDPTNDATIAWPADREKLDVGTLTVDRVEGEANGNCRDVNFDPLILPAGIEPSDDPLLSARSAVYSQSFTRREGEMKSPSAVQTPGAGAGS